MNRYNYVCNPEPQFEAPDYHRSRPSFIRKLVNYTKKRRVTMWSGFYTLTPLDPKKLTPINRQRHFNKHRARAIQAVAECAAHHLNIVTGRVMLSVEAMAELCGLSTKSKAGNISITRCSRAVIELERFGIFNCEKVWDRALGMWIPKRIYVTGLFIEMCGLSIKDWESAQNQQLGYMKRGLSIEEQEQLTITEAKRRDKEQHTKAAFEYRRKKHGLAKARKLAARLREKTISDSRATVLRNIIKRMPTDELKAMNHHDLDALVRKELNYLLKLADDPPIH